MSPAIRAGLTAFIVLCGGHTAVLAQGVQPGEAESSTRAANEAVRGALNFADRVDFEQARRGFIAAIPDGHIAGSRPFPTWSMRQEYIARFILDAREERGVTILIIEHHMDVVTAICDRVVVLSYGEIISEGEPQEAISHPRVVSAYLGERAAKRHQREVAS